MTGSEASTFDALDLTDDDIAFADEVRAWLSTHLVGEFAEHRGIGSPTDEEGWDVRRRWEHELANGGWLGLSWPTEFGGRGATLTQEVVFELEYARQQAPARANFQGLDLLGPTLMRFGSDEIRRRFLPRILDCTDIWGQGFSEPAAGSDLAAISTRAVLDGEQWVIDGQKVWTTFGHRADWLYVLVRTEAGSKRHHGLTMLLVPADALGVEVRPIRNMAGQDEFSEIFFDGARTDADLVVGEVGGGWAVAMGLLGVERGTTLLPMQMAFEREVAEAVQLAQKLGRGCDPEVRQALARAYRDIRVLRATVLRALAPVMAGGEPGRETAMTKIFASEVHQRFVESAWRLLGPAALVVDGSLDDRQRRFLLSRAETIYGGTSQIQRNLIAERTLGLPREPRPS